MKTLKTIGMTTACLLAGLAGQASGQCMQYAQFVAGDTQNNMFNGVSVAIDGSYVLTGAESKNAPAAAAAGEVYCWAPISGTWGQVSHFQADDPTTNAYFGASVGIGGANLWAVVGAPGVGSNTGAAYFFKRNFQTGLWSQNLKVTFPGGVSGDKFGYAVSMNKVGQIAAVATPNADVSDIFGTTTHAGHVMVYLQSGNSWVYDGDLYESDPAVRHTNDGYGTAISADGDRVLVGCRNGDGPGKTDCGYVNVWSRAAGGGWSGNGNLYAPDGAASDHFGAAVSLWGNWAAIGAPEATVAGLSGEGAVYVLKFINGYWTLDGKLTATDGLPSLGFGSSVSIGNNTVVVGTSSGPQRTYVFRRTPAGQWVQDRRIQNPGASGDAFGSAVAFDWDTLVTGAWGFDTPNYQQMGAAYLYKVPTEGSDSCEGATPVTQGTYTGCTMQCTIDGYSTCGTASNPGPDIWYSYTAPASGTVTIDTQGSQLDTILSVHAGCPAGQANTIICSDDFAAPQRWSKVSVPVTQGSTYLIRIAGYGGATGTYTLNVGDVTACYPNCDQSSTPPVLNVLDFSCFLQKFAAADAYANCDGSVAAPVLNVLDFTCFLQKFAAGCN